MFLFVAGCAEVGPPPGGEEDKKGPILLESTPANGALGVVAGDEVVLTFSETLVKPDQGTAVFVSPCPVRPPQVEWKGNRLRILFAEPLLTNRTYVISVNTTVADLRRNRLDSAVTLAFSTGQTIDTGLVSGQVLSQDGKPAMGWAVGLYALTQFEQYTLADSVHPIYLTTTGNNGLFTLPYLPSGAYSLIAFLDKNRDDLFNPAVEPFAVPDRDILVGGGLPLNRLILAGTVLDSVAPQIISVVSTEDDLVRMRLSRTIDPSYLKDHFDQTLLTLRSDSSAVDYRCSGFLESDLDQTNVLTGFFADAPEGLYRLSLTHKSDAPPLARDSVVIKRQPDRTPPQIVRTLPGDKPLFVNQVKCGLMISEPIDKTKLNEQSLVLWEDSARLVQIKAVWSDVFHLNLVPQELNAGHKYRLDISEFDFRDLSGNALGDSLRSYRFATLDADSVGSITGQVVVTIPHKVQETAVLSFQNTASKSVFTVEVETLQAGALSVPRPFSLDVPPGKYLVSGFLDADGNRKLTPGTINPYRPSETQAFLVDTIAVRARFETAGVAFKFE
ncbi:MAG: Ig-like domain-containing protein [candidate division Zixibacteria bacterium]|nr:Ig-like domain-containing protein [candidate division Zixibacteria bacterium]